MGYSILGIVVRDSRKPCAQYFSTAHTFWVDIWNCDGTSFIKAHRLAGRVHDQIKVPPGSYIVQGYGWCRNVVTDLVMVNVGCNETVCVNLLPTPVRLCWWRALIGLKYGTVVASPEKSVKEMIPKEVADRLNKILTEAMNYLPKEDMLPVGITEEELRKRMDEAK